MRHRRAISLLAIAFCVFAQEWPVFHGCAISPNGMWACEKESSFVLVSWDRGLSWQNLGRPALTGRWLYDVFFLNDSFGWVAAEGAFIFRTTDGGQSWHTQAQGGAKFAQRVFMLDSAYGWVACGEAIILKTTDGGEYWEQVILPNPPFPRDTVDFYGVSFVDRNTGFICAGRFPRGDTFTKGQGYIARTTDGGASWVLLRRDTVYDFFDCHFISQNEGWVVGGNDRNLEPCILHTTDGGASWRLSTPTGFYLRACHFIGRHAWASGMFGTVIRTTDGGQTWAPQYTGIQGTLFDIEFIDTLHGIASGTGFVLYTTDGGRNWRRFSVAIKDEKLQEAPKFRRGFLSATSDRDWLSKGALIYDATGRRCADINKKGLYFIEEKGVITKVLVLVK